MRRCVVALCGLLPPLALLGCVEAEREPSDPPPPQVTAFDLESEEGKADGLVFDAHRLIDDAAFTDAFAFDVADVQAFFEHTPYGRRSFLADYVEGGWTAAELIVDAARRHGINPLVFLVKLQAEMGLVSRNGWPTRFQIDHALGCACPDGGGCDARQSGFARQVECAGALFRDYLDELASNGRTRSGWRVNARRQAGDGLWVTPRNAATAALYTYTPWVLPNRGGNWLFWNILQKYRRHLAVDIPEPNEGWIGGACDGDSACDYSGGMCLHGLPGGLCTLPCDRYCPDLGTANTSITFCTDVGSVIAGVPDGYCLSRCAPGLYPSNGGCRQGYTCTDAPRFGDPSVWVGVCWPN